MVLRNVHIREEKCEDNLTIPVLAEAINLAESVQRRGQERDRRRSRSPPGARVEKNRDKDRTELMASIEAIRNRLSASCFALRISPCEVSTQGTAVRSGV